MPCHAKLVCWKIEFSVSKPSFLPSFLPFFLRFIKFSYCAFSEAKANQFVALGRRIVQFYFSILSSFFLCSPKHRLTESTWELLLILSSHPLHRLPLFFDVNCYLEQRRQRIFLFIISIIELLLFRVQLFIYLFISPDKSNDHIYFRCMILFLALPCCVKFVRLPFHRSSSGVQFIRFSRIWTSRRIRPKLKWTRSCWLYSKFKCRSSLPLSLCLSVCLSIYLSSNPPCLSHRGPRTTTAIRYHGNRIFTHSSHSKGIASLK